MTAYYNEIDPYCCQWLKDLIDTGLIAPGHVDSRSITDVTPNDLLGYTQCHFFAGLGGWSLALRLAGWPDERPAWSGSCPCQPYSSAGKQQGDADPRNLWPAFFRLIRECHPSICFGEQVSSAIRHGWLDRVCGDLEAENYACGAAVLGAHSVGAPHIRQRLYWCAERLGHCDSQRQGAIGGVCDWQGADTEGSADRVAESTGVESVATDGHADTRRWWGNSEQTGMGSGADRVANTQCDGGRRDQQERRPEERTADGRTGAGTDNGRWSSGRGADGLPEDLADKRGRRFDSVPPTHSSTDIGLGDSAQRGLGIDWRAQGDTGHAAQPDAVDGLGNAYIARPQPRDGTTTTDRHGCAAEPDGGKAWAHYTIVYCRDDKARRISAQPGDEPLAAGIPRVLGPSLSRLRSVAKDARRNRVGRLRAYGNAIVPQVAAEFVRAYLADTR